MQPYQFWRCESTADGSGVSHAAPRAGGGVDAALSGLRVCWDARRVEVARRHAGRVHRHAAVSRAVHTWNEDILRAERHVEGRA